MTLSRRQSVVALICLFIIAFAVRAYYPPHNPDPWLTRTQNFKTAVETQDWAETFQRRHPGFTTLAIGGAALQIYDMFEPQTRALFQWAVPPYTTEYGWSVSVGVWGLSLVISGLIVAIVWLLQRLADWPTALAAAVLLTFSPFSLAHGRSYHVDGLVSTCMLLSAISMLLQIKTGKYRYLFLSGIAGGLAFLSKTPSLFLIPFTLLVLVRQLVGRLSSGWTDHQDNWPRWILAEIWQTLLLPMLIWLLMAALMFALWPAMWIQPGQVLSNMFTGTQIHVNKPHGNPRFFAGRIHYDHPGFRLYPLLLIFNSTFLTIIFLVAALGLYTFWRRTRPPLQSKYFWLVVSYVVFFTLQMSIGAKQSERYILPAYLALDVLAAIGIGGIIDLMLRALAGRHELLYRYFPSLVIGLVATSLIGMVIRYAPDYSAHHNYLLGGNPVAVAMVEVGSGQDAGTAHIGSYLNRYAQADTDIVAVDGNSRAMAMYYKGQIESIKGLDQEADFYLFSLEIRQRDLGGSGWEEVWRAHKDCVPVLTVSFDGVEYMRLYAEQSEASLPVIAIRHGGRGFIALAWIWTVGMVLAVKWALRKKTRAKVLNTVPPQAEDDAHLSSLKSWFDPLFYTLLAVLIIQLAGAQTMWSHTSNNPVILGRYDLDYFVLLAVYHLMIVGWITLIGCFVASTIRHEYRKIARFQKLFSNRFLNIGVVSLAWAVALPIVFVLTTRGVVQSMAVTGVVVTLLISTVLFLAHTFGLLFQART
jgi:4-amino-4-deoxy-L-arabinose transferase-like glycosyltransferase